MRLILKAACPTDPVRDVEIERRTEELITLHFRSSLFSQKLFICLNGASIAALCDFLEENVDTGKEAAQPLEFDLSLSEALQDAEEVLKSFVEDGYEEYKKLYAKTRRAHQYFKTRSQEAEDASSPSKG